MTVESSNVDQQAIINQVAAKNAGHYLAVPDSDWEQRRENPLLRYSNCHVTFHILIPDLPWPDFELVSDLAIDSYERDMLAYAYRNQRPFQTRMIGEQPAPITAVFPPEIRLCSEDAMIRLGLPGIQERRVEFNARTFVTEFHKAPDRVLHITLRPAEGFHVNEYDLLKLAKLWEGGERLTEPVSFESNGVRLTEEWPLDVTDPNAPLLDSYTSKTLTSLADWSGLADLSRSAASQRLFCVGTLDLLDKDSSVQSLLASIRKLHARPEEYSEVADALSEDIDVSELPEARREIGDEWRRIVAVGGLVQGLLDFTAIGVDELSDVYAAAFGSQEGSSNSSPPRSLVAVHKGTLFSLSSDTERNLKWKTWVNPYLAIPHAVSLHNEERMLEARKSALAAVGQNEDQLALAAAASDGRWWEPSGVRQPPMTQARLQLERASEQLEEFVPNVFVYPAERQVYDTCHTTRAIADIRNEAKEQLELSRNSVDYREKRHGAVFAIIALTLGIIATVEGYFIQTDALRTGPLVAFAVVGILPIVIYGAFYFWRRHH